MRARIAIRRAVSGSVRSTRLNFPVANYVWAAAGHVVLRAAHWSLAWKLLFTGPAIRGVQLRLTLLPRWHPSRRIRICDAQRQSLCQSCMIWSTVIAPYLIARQVRTPSAGSTPTTASERVRQPGAKRAQHMAPAALA
eukprot:SAG31_NODE_1738_length_7402_cov_14.270163_8_plen_138_part_00